MHTWDFHLGTELKYHWYLQSMYTSVSVTNWTNVSMKLLLDFMIRPGIMDSYNLNSQATYFIHIQSPSTFFYACTRSKVLNVALCSEEKLYHYTVFCEVETNLLRIYALISPNFTCSARIFHFITYPESLSIKSIPGGSSLELTGDWQHVPNFRRIPVAL